MKVGSFSSKICGRFLRSKLQELFGKNADFYRDLSRGIDNRPVDPNGVRKSIGCEETLDRDTFDLSYLEGVLQEQALELAEQMQSLELFARTVTLKVKYENFESITRSQTTTAVFWSREQILERLIWMLQNATEVGSRGVRLIGSSVSGLLARSDPLQLWFDFDQKRDSLFSTQIETGTIKQYE